MPDQTQTITCTVVPSGGAVMVHFQSEAPGPWLLTRCLPQPDGSQNQVVTLYHGAALPNPVRKWLDIGDGLNEPLGSANPATTYMYTLQTPWGSISSAPISAARTMRVEFVDFTKIFLRLLEGAFASVQLPEGLKRPSVIVAMPLTGRPSLPLISINEVLLQQAQVPIGRGTEANQQGNSYVLSEQVQRRFQITVLANSIEERDFYRYAVIGIFQTMIGSVLAEYGQGIAASFQSANSQKTDGENSPGFYFSDISLEFTGSFAVVVTTDFPKLVGIDFSDQTGRVTGVGDVEPGPT